MHRAFGWVGWLMVKFAWDFGIIPLILFYWKNRNHLVCEISGDIYLKITILRTL